LTFLHIKEFSINSAVLFKPKERTVIGQCSVYFLPRDAH